MQKLISFWNQNRVKIVIIGLIIIFIIILIFTINTILSTNTENTNQVTENKIVDISKPTESVITGESISENITENNMKMVGDFVNFCNNKDYQNAYNLLTDDCKNELFQNLQVFINNYCNQVFQKNMTYSLELWYQSNLGYTYRVTYKENNILETGNINPSTNKEDYITIVKTEAGDKLNISNFIGKEEINKETQNEGIRINIKERIRYRTYERNLIEIENNTDNTILLSKGINGNDICLVDTNDTEYNSILNEIAPENLELQPHSKKTILISFNKMYNLYRAIDRVRFKNIILNKDEYNMNNTTARRIGIEIAI